MPTCIQVGSAAEYRQVLQQHRIELDPERRADAIWEAVSAAAQSAGGQVPASSRADLLPEVTNLVESPTAVLGTFDEAFLRLPRSELNERLVRAYFCSHFDCEWLRSLSASVKQFLRCAGHRSNLGYARHPGGLGHLWGEILIDMPMCTALKLRREILVMVMRKHQRYFPVHDAGGALLPAFVTVANGAIDEPTVRVRQSPCCTVSAAPEVASACSWALYSRHLHDHSNNSA